MEKVTGVSETVFEQENSEQTVLYYYVLFAPCKPVDISWRLPQQWSPWLDS